MSNCTARTRHSTTASLQCRAVRVPDAALDEVRERGFVARRGLPRARRAARPRRRRCGCTSRSPTTTSPRPASIPQYAASQFAGVEEFPYRSWDLNHLAFHPDLVDAAERFLGTPELHLYKVELWAKYAGAIDYDQPLHRDYGSHSLVVPRRDGRYQQLTTFVFLSDVTGDDGPTRIVPLRATARTSRSRRSTATSARSPTREVPGDRAGREPARVPHRRPAPRARTSPAPGRSRFSLLADYQARGTTWGGKMAWPKQSPERWAKLMPQCSVRERDLFGFPRPGDDYWNEQTLDRRRRPLSRHRHGAVPPVSTPTPASSHHGTGRDAGAAVGPCRTRGAARARRARRAPRSGARRGARHVGVRRHRADAARRDLPHRVAHEADHRRRHDDPRRRRRARASKIRSTTCCPSWPTGACSAASTPSSTTPFPRGVPSPWRTS